MSRLAPMSTPRVGSLSSRTLGCVAIQRAMMTFCWLPPLSEVMRVRAAPGDDLQPLGVALESPLHRRLADEPASAVRTGGRDAEVVEDRARAEQRLLATVARHVGDAGRVRIRAGAQLVLAVRRHAEHAPAVRLHPAQHLQEAILAMALQAGQADDLPGTELDVDRSCGLVQLDAGGAQRDRPGGGRPMLSVAAASSVACSTPVISCTSSRDVTCPRILVATHSPERMTVMRSATSSTSSIRCEISRIATPCGAGVRGSRRGCRGW